jgi:hypothetical protein
MTDSHRPLVLVVAIVAAALAMALFIAASARDVEHRPVGQAFDVAPAHAATDASVPAASPPSNAVTLPEEPTPTF